MTSRQASWPTLARVIKKQEYAIELQLATEKDHYLPGEQLTGKIYLVAKESIRVSKLVAVVEGYNKVSWEEGRKTANYSEEVKLFEERILVRAFNKPIPVGRYFFKFSYVVPEFLPSSFSLESCKRTLQWEDIKMHEASVKYSIKAVLEKDDVSIGQEAVQPFLIHSTPEQTETQRKQDITEQIKTFGCFPRGYITVSVRIDKDCYRHDDVLGLTLEITNMTALVCKNIIAVLFRKLKVLANRSQRNIRTKEYMLEFEDVPSGEKAVFKRDLDLSESDVLPTTNSRNIKCNYVLAVRCEVPFATSIDATLPVTMILEPDANYHKTLPPDQLYRPWKN